MLNQICLVGVVKDVVKNEDDEYFILEVERSFKNFEGTFEKDLMKCRLWKSSVEGAHLHVQVNSKVSINGRLVSKDATSFYIQVYDLEYLSK